MQDARAWRVLNAKFRLPAASTFDDIGVTPLDAASDSPVRSQQARKQDRTTALDRSLTVFSACRAAPARSADVRLLELASLLVRLLAHG